MITAAQQRAPEAEFLSQGDVVGGCWIRQPAGDLVFLEKLGTLFSGKPDFRSHREAFQDNTKQFIVAEARRASAVILSYSCDVDKVLEHIASGQPSNPSELCVVAPVYPMTNYPRMVDDIRGDAVENIAYIEPAQGRGELVVDFSFAQSIPMRELLGAIAAGTREFGLDEQGRTELMRRWARHFGSTERV